MSEQKASSTRSVQSSDGTIIAYERFGNGPPLILVGGALTSARRSFPSFVQLAQALSSTFTVYTYDRRGRGDSGDNPPYSVDRERRAGIGFHHGNRAGRISDYVGVWPPQRR